MLGSKCTPLVQFSWLTASPPALGSVITSSRKPSLIPKLGQVTLGSPAAVLPSLGHPCLGTGLSLTLACEPRKGRALVVWATLCPLGAEEVPGGVSGGWIVRDRGHDLPAVRVVSEPAGVSRSQRRIEALFPFTLEPNLFSLQDLVCCSVTTQEQDMGLFDRCSPGLGTRR